MQQIKINTTNSETLEFITATVKDIENLEKFTIQKITLEDVTDPTLEWGGSKWYWEIKSKTPINPVDNAMLASCIDPDNAGDLHLNHDRKNQIYKFTLEVY